MDTLYLSLQKESRKILILIQLHSLPGRCISSSTFSSSPSSKTIAFHFRQLRVIYKEELAHVVVLNRRAVSK